MSAQSIHVKVFRRAPFGRAWWRQMVGTVPSCRYQDAEPWLRRAPGPKFEECINGRTVADGACFGVDVSSIVERLKAITRGLDNRVIRNPETLRSLLTFAPLDPRDRHQQVHVAQLFDQQFDDAYDAQVEDVMTRQELPSGDREEQDNDRRRRVREERQQAEEERRQAR